MKTAEQVISWFRDKGLLNRIFLYNKTMPTADSYDISYMLSNPKPNIIGSGFLWTHTKEGFLYWDQVDSQFIRFWYDNV